MTTAQNAPVEATSRMNSIISSTGMPRRNSMSHPVGMRSQAIDELRMRDSTTPSAMAPTAATAAACSVDPALPADRARLGLHAGAD